MADTTINGLATENTSPTANDLLVLWNVAAGRTEKIKRSNLIGGVITGGGTVATGGNTLTVPASGTAALLGTAQTFTVTKTFTPSSGNAIIVTAVAGVAGDIFLTNVDLGNNVAGPSLAVGRNTNAGAEGPVAGHIQLNGAVGAGSRRIWCDSSGKLRIHDQAPTGSSGSPAVADTAGTVVGDQTSSLDTKNVVGEAAPIDEVLAAVRQGAEAVRRFVYKSGSFNGEEFSGVVVDYAPRYGMDRDEAHPAGKSLNVVNAVGDLLMAVAWLVERVSDQK